MRVLLVSDVHGNLAALEAVAAEPHDAVICLGDLVGYGPEPAACVRWARDEGAIMVKGNHERALAEHAPPGCREHFLWLAEATAGLTASRMTAEEVRALDALPRWADFELDGRRCLCVHAAPSDPLYRYLGPDPAAWEAEVAGLDVDFVFVGHTHVQFMLDCAGTLVVNPGSVGQPKDGDPRAAYAVIENGTVALKRVSYAIERTVEGLRRASLPAAAVRALAAMLRTGRAGDALDPARAVRAGDGSGAGEQVQP
jgi:putative phosphoesterase